MLKKNKKIVYLSMLIVLLLLILSTQGISAQVERRFEGQKLILEIPGGTNAEVTEKYIIAPFEEETGAEIIIAEHGTSADALSKLMTGKATGDFPCDVIELGGGFQERCLIIGGLLQPMDYRKITNLSGLFPAAQPRYKISPYMGYGPVFFTGSQPLVYRTDLIKTDITSWYDLFNPEFKGKIGFMSPINVGGINILWAFQESEGGDMYDPSLSKAFELLEEKLVPQKPIIWSSSAQSQVLISQGDMWISQMWDGRAYDLKRKGLPIKIIIPKEGAWATQTTFDIVEGCKNIELAHAFLDYRLSPKAQAAFTSNIFYGFTNPLAEQYVSKEILEIVLSAKEMEKLRFIDYVYQAEHQEEWTQRFLEMFN